MTRPELDAAVARLLADRVKQGLTEKVTDPSALAQIAAIVAPEVST